ncbi:MarR family winged helix-turn-helix transcriptional regulator [Antarctobacter heliothermus]|uniref:DNA-binding transcriptional regulator, MarR family n=1 Tax=Antarctobacter heliothermus TaxID=74033 RepID=A0A239IP62_9RHOB|nr:MarR family winged helix-turn-helix transcriptional regulator [Antarctobacter heliothermus]SNS95349.1 DNA-binding transcriptional regulator, MarR family [Antarctobacter heliothermus]
MTTRSDPPPFDLASFTPYRLAVAAEKTSEALARQYRERFGISIPEWRVLVHLAQPLDGAATISVRDIEERVAMEKSKVSRAASRLEASGYIEKTVDAGDRRLVRLALTDKGRRMMADLLPLAMAYQQKIEARLAESFAGLEAALDAILDAE